jgi:UDP:flavonoid glycosyltransferase YjiC (YdhE family)
MKFLFTTLPANFHFAPYLPGITLARNCDLMVHHGGYGSCQTGLFTGTPAVIIPTFSERESNARRVADVGAGEFVLPKIGSDGKRMVDMDELRISIARVLSDPSYLKNAQVQSQKLAAFGGPERVVQIIEDFVTTCPVINNAEG